MAPKRISEYDRKRKFSKTPEPQGVVETEKREGELRFVIHKHDATRLHYDLRLESNGVMVSWAVPKGPSFDPQEKHLAVHVEDHPLEYRNFEGTIPEGNYGAGTVMIWDEGTYEPAGADRGKNNITSGLKKGHVALIFKGKKLTGEFELVQIRDEENGKNWLLIKKDDEYAGTQIRNDDISARSGRTLSQIAKGESSSDISEILKDASKLHMPQRIEPMLATLIDQPFDNRDFLFEIKWDGYRTIAFVKKGDVKLVSRNQISFDDKFSQIQKALKSITFDVVLDGEVVALDSKGRANFEALQNWQENPEGTLVYIIFDVLYYDKFDLKNLPLASRKKILSAVIPPNPAFIVSDYIQGDGIGFFNACVKEGIEGIIAKKIDSTYHEKTRGDDWLKIKHIKEDEAVIGGYTEARGARKHFGALVLGQYKNGKLTYIGHTGGGFDEEKLKSILTKLEPLKIEECPFEIEPETNAPVTWVKPKLVAQVKFSEWTRDNIMRQPIFLGLREDKDPLDVVREEVRDEEEVVTNSQSQVEIKNLDKIFWPKHGYTKKDLIDYYEKISDVMLPYLLGRPHSLFRNPNGVKSPGFFQKDVKDIAPKFIETFSDYLKSEKRSVNYLVCKNRESLLYMVSLGCIEINPWLSRVDSPENPDFAVLDLDPEAIGFDMVVDVALGIQKVLDKAEILSFPKTSGKTGIHILIPLGAAYSYDQSKEFAEILANVVNSQMPDVTSIERSPSKRQRKVYIDFLQNRYSQTITAPYSLRPTEDATVSTPLLWREVNKNLNPKDFTIRTIFKRIEKMGDIYKDILSKGIDMTASIAKLSKI